MKRLSSHKKEDVTMKNLLAPERGTAEFVNRSLTAYYDNDENLAIVLGNKKLGN